MTQEQAQQLQALFAETLRQPPAERAAFAAAACGDDDLLRRELEALLRADHQADEDHFLDGFEEGTRSPGGLGPDALLTEALLHQNLTGQSIGPYQILRLIGSGGMGDVYLARRTQPFRQHVALKLSQPGQHTRHTRLRFEMERQILASLSHPNIARLFDGGTTDDGRSYFVMEYVDGLPVTTYCDAKRLSITERLGLFRVVCQAVHYAHQNLVVHRDLKPSNILVTQEGVVKLLDFGVAKLLNPNLSHLPVPVTRTENRVMTPEYASPEQVRGETLTTASDIYGLGLLLYELLTGFRAHDIEDGSLLELERVICHKEIERPSHCLARQPAPPGRPAPRLAGRDPLAPDAPSTATQAAAARGTTAESLRRRLRGDLDTIVEMALRKEPHRRYASAEQFSDDVARYLAGAPVLAHRDSRRYRLQKFIRRNKISVAAAGVVFLSLVMGLGVALWQTRQAWHAQEQTQHALAQAHAVTAFLMDLFQAADPYEEAFGDTIAARELLARGLARAEVLSAQPDVQAEMLDVVGRMYYNLGRYDEAQEPLARALALRRAQLGPAHPDVAASLQHLASVLVSRGDLSGAEPLFREALALHHRLQSVQHPDYVMTVQMLADLLRRQGRYDEAVPLFEQALTLSREVLGEAHPHVAATLNNFALLKQHLGDFAEAERLTRDALALNRRLLGEGHPEIATNLSNLASLRQDMGDYDMAEALLREALDRRRRYLGDDHPQTATAFDDLASILHIQGDLDTAEAFHRRALSIRRQRLGNEHPMVAASLNNLGLLLSEKGDQEGAEPLMREALAIRRRTLGDEHPYIAFSMNNLAVILRRKGDLEGAAALVSASLTLRKQVLGDDHPTVARAQQNMASILREQGHYAVSESLYIDVLARYRLHFEEEHPRIQEVYDGLSTLYTAWGKSDQARHYRALMIEPRP